MKSLFSAGRNILWGFDEDGKPSADIEIVLSILEKQTVLGPGGLTDSTNYETVRFSVTADGLSALIRSLECFRDELDREEKLVKPIKRKGK